ncbi:DNA/RNA nuclease SfsA [Clostridium sp. AM58-1XD]|uniref:DNA/RNA nuclease SfsA n=1 Tax=Clostridium sp. AM58-1XD TaxID=2292307 RepID=UPI000E52067F|nr:DNA/RNA nuclease SfsA [Clostridium sp. AM58-1XD]RGY95171.1 DNA/RNA nuclease SfsA [Clostridium sp. AM58-1XD]
MNYEHIKRARFIDRPNRFIANASLISPDQGNDKSTIGPIHEESSMVICHVKNTGRCRELLLPGAEILLQYHPNAAASGRRTQYSLIGVYKSSSNLPEGRLLINMDSQAPNQAAYEWLSAQDYAENIRREVTFGSSRFDLAFDLNGKQAYMEVKGVTLEEDGIARFPDAPTVRGLKHIEELTAMAKKGIPCFLLFVIQMKSITQFEPNMATQPEFGHALTTAQKSGVHILAYDCIITENSMVIDAPVPVFLPV